MPEQVAQRSMVCPTDLPDALPFPADVFPPPIANFVRGLAASKQCPDDFPGVAVLTVAAACIGASRCALIEGDWREKPVLYTVLVAEPGSRKTPVLRAVMAPLYEAQTREVNLYEARKARHEVALEGWRRRQRTPSSSSPSSDLEPKPELEPLRHLFAIDMTVEALAPILLDCPRGLLVFRDELAAWVRGMDQYKGGKGTDRQFWLSCWSGEPVKVDRKTSDESIYLPHPYLSVLGSTQPDMLTEFEDSRGREDGFLHRILFSYPPPQAPVEWGALVPVDGTVWNLVVNRLLHLTACANGAPEALPFSQEALAYWSAWYNLHQHGRQDINLPRALVYAWSKYEAYCARFALVLALLRKVCDSLNDSPDSTLAGSIEACDVRGAVRLVDYFKSHARKAHWELRRSDDDKKVDDFKRWLLTLPTTAAPMREISRRFHLTKSQTLELVRKAIDRGLGKVTCTVSSNHKTVDYFTYSPDEEGETAPCQASA